MNRIVIVGHLGKDPELKKTANGGNMATFSVATTFSYKDKEGERKEKTTWHNCVSFGKQADVVAKYLFKGSHVAIEGRVENTSTTNEVGEKKFWSNIVVGEIEFLSRPSEKRESDKKFNADDAVGNDAAGDDDWIPF